MSQGGAESMINKLELGPVGQDYEEIRPLNEQAGMSDLFLAHKKGMNINVVIKRVQRNVQSDVDEKNESEILKTVKHQYLPQIYDIIQGVDGYLYTVMDFIRGQNLQDYVALHGPVTQKQAHLWGCQLCEAVQYLHDDKNHKPTIIHCDIKPRNIMITESGDICLIDFGTSLMFRDGVQATSFLTPGYAAPEQYEAARLNWSQPGRTYNSSVNSPSVEEGTVLARDESTVLAVGSEGTVLATEQEGSVLAADPEGTILAQFQRAEGTAIEEGWKHIITKSTDVYAIGATLYFAVTGRRPEESIQDVMPLDKLKPNVSSSMVRIISRAMSKEPSRRFPDASAMLDALQHVDQMEESYRKFVVRKRVMALALSGAFLLSLASTVYGFYRIRSERENEYLNLISAAEKAGDSGRYDEGRNLLERAIQQQPTRADAYLGLAAMLYEQGEYQSALDLLNNALYSGNLKVEDLDETVQGEWYYILGSCLYELTEYDEAISALQQAVSSPGVAPAYYRSLAIALANNGEIGKAQDTLDELEEKGGSSSDCDIVRAEIAGIQGEYQQAMAYYHAVFRDSKDQQLLSHAYLSAAQLCEKEDDVVQAIEILEESQDALDQNHNILQRTMLADLYSQAAAEFPNQAQEYYNQAADVLKSLIDEGVGTFATSLNMANVQQALGNYENALQYLLELRDQYPQDYRTEMQLAYLYIDWQGAIPLNQRDYHQALAYYNIAQEKYQQALANGQEDQNMVVLSNLIGQLQSAGWL